MAAAWNPEGWYVTIYGCDSKPDLDSLGFAFLADLEEMVTAETAIKKNVEMSKLSPRYIQKMVETEMLGNVLLEESVWRKSYVIEVLEATFYDSDWCRRDLDEICQVWAKPYKFLYIDPDHYDIHTMTVFVNKARAIVGQYSDEDAEIPDPSDPLKRIPIRKAKIEVKAKYPGIVL